MAQIIVRNLDGDVKARLVNRARLHGRSMEEEVREILFAAAMADGDAPQAGVGTAISGLFAEIGFRDDEIVEEIRGGGLEDVELDP